MELSVFLAVLAGAACHAAWNALLKLDLEPVAAMALIGTMSGVICLPLVPVFGFPDAGALPFLAGSVVAHVGYFLGLTRAYRSGDLSQVYPVARGSAPLLTALGAAVLTAEPIGLSGWLGIAVLAGGVALLSLRGGRSSRLDLPTVGFALLTGCTICAYSLFDGLGARAAQNPHVYTIWLFILDGIAMLAIAFAMRGQVMGETLRRYWRRGVAGGALSLGAYWIAIWAMTVAPIALVAALRETSVLFAALIGVVVLREPLTRWRIAAALLILCGLVFIRLA